MSSDPLRTKIFLISCSFWENLANLYVGGGPTGSAPDNVSGSDKMRFSTKNLDSMCPLLVDAVKSPPWSYQKVRKSRARPHVINLTHNFSGGSRISPRRGRQLPRGAANIRFRQNFPKTAWNWKNLDPRGGASKILLCRSATAFGWCLFHGQSSAATGLRTGMSS